MPNGYVPGLPLAGGGAGTPTWGTCNLEGTSGSWNVATVSLSTPADNEFWLIASSCASSTNNYYPGASQHTTQTAVGIMLCHNGANGWTTGCLSILKPRPDATWATTVNINLNGNYPSSSCMRLSYTEGFEMRPYKAVYQQTSSSVNNVTVNPGTNPGPYPGGLCVAWANHEAGYASGQTGISSASQDAGWVGGTYGGALSAVAVYYLSTTEIETAPSVNFTTVYSPNCWISGYSYIR